MQFDVANIICLFVEDALELPFTIYADLIPDAGKDGACIRHEPAPAAERRFIDGSRLLSWNLTFYIRCRKAEKAREYAKGITDILDGATIDGPGTSTKIECEAATLPQFIGIDDKKLTTYSAAITAQYLEETDNE